MLRSALEISATDNALKLCPGNIRKMINHLPVKLVGGGFTASGVIAGVADNAVTIITAKHNISIHGKQQRRLDPLQYFKDNITVTAALGGEEASAGLDVIKLFDAAGFDTGYDVIGLLIRDSEFAKLVRKILANAGIWGSKQRRIWTFIKPGDTELSHIEQNRHTMADGYVVQAGYGHTKKNKLGSVGVLQHLVRTNSDDFEVEHIDTEHNGSKDILVFEASDNASTWEGDSGGPCFYVTSDRKQIHLLGVNLGSNFYRDKDDAGGAIENNAVTLIRQGVADWVITQTIAKMTQLRRFGLL